MAELPIMPYLGDAYLADTRHLSLEEHGAYHLLLLIAWRSPNQAIPDDDKRIAQMLGITAARWAKLRETVMAFWTPTEHGYVQKRQKKVWEKTCQRVEKRRNAANARWGAKSLKTNGGGDANAYANGYPNEDANAYATKTKTKEPNGSIETSNDVSCEKPVKPQEIVDAWNIIAERKGLAKVAKLTPKRLQQLNARIRENSLEEISTALAAIERSAFLCGGGKDGWRASFDFLLQPSSFVKLLEGSYDH